MKKAFIALFTILLFSTHSFSQKSKSFSEDPESFFSELGEFMKAGKQKALIETFTEFSTLWQGGMMSGQAEDDFIQLANTMRNARYNASPDFNNFLKSTMSFYSNEVNENQFITYQAVLDSLIRKKQSRADIRDYMSFFTDLNKGKILNGKKGRQWAVEDLDYEIGMKKELYINFDNTTLYLYGTKDTLSVERTSGRYFPKKKIWKGKEGEGTWERVGLSGNQVYATFSRYQVSTKDQGFTADSVEFTNSMAFEGTRAGIYKDQLDGKGENASFPQFKSYESSFTLDDLDYYLIYEGGFGMEGQTILGSGAGRKPAKLTILRNEKKWMVLRSFSFSIKPHLIQSGNCQATIFVENDSIYHPSLSLTIERKNALIKLSVSPQNLVQTPFHNTYHNLDITADYVECQLDSSFFDIKSKRDPDGRAYYESINYFSRKRFEKLQGGMGYNPIERFYDLFDLNDKRDYTEDEIQGFFNVPSIASVQPLLVLMAAQGYLHYDTHNKEILLQDKLFTYINARRKKIDYDVLLVNSKIKDKPNSRFYFEDNRLEVKGVSSIKLSDSQDVQIFPAQQTVNFFQNRDMKFNGYLKAGRFEYFGSGFEFSYEDFKIDMTKVDSMMFNFPDEKNGGILRRVNTVIQDITGILYIDKADNKSGRLKAPHHPIFDCTNGAYVYYDYKSVFNGVYDRERFNFKLKPFVVDSLDNFSMKGMNLFGSFNSARILPVFDQKLYLQPDFSLGFTTETPEEGYPLYNGTGHCNMKIFLSNKGLRGDGTFTYNGAEINSDDMLFFPDSMVAMKTVFAMKDDDRKKFPEVTSENCQLNWTPYHDTMIIAVKDSTAFINMYEPESFLKGELVFTKQNMYGKGEFNYRESIIQSNYYNFKYADLAADSSSIEIYEEEMELIALANDSVRIQIDIKNQKLKGETNSDDVFTRLAVNQYNTNIPFFEWDVNAKKVYLSKGKGNDDLDFFFVSTNPTFDSLTFAPSSAELDLDSFGIKAHDIAYFLVGDAKVKPSTSISIDEKGEIPALEDAEILASAENEYHIVRKASVNIFSSKRLTATGMYNYTDPNGNIWEIAMSDIRTTEEGITKGVGDIPDSMKFHFGTNIGYNGHLIFESNRKEIEFSGEVNIEHPNAEFLGTEKFKFDGLVSFDSLYFKIDDAKNILGQELHTGIFLNAKTLEIYPVFLGVKQTPEDLELFRATGDLAFEQDSNMFVIAGFDRYYSDDPRPSQWVYNLDTNQIYMDGPLDMDYDFENVKLSISGQFNYDLTAKTSQLFMSGGINFPIENGAIKVMSDSIINFGYFNSDANNLKEFVIAGVARQVEEKDYQKVIASIYKDAVIPTTKEYQPFFSFSETEIIWDSTSRSFHNKEQIGIANLGIYPVNKNLNGRIDFFQTLFTDTMTISLEGNAGNWYLFTFVDEEMYISSSDQEFVSKALDKKPKGLIGKMSYKEATEKQVEKARKKIIRKEEE